MKAKIIGQNHTVINYELNGRKRFIVEPIRETALRKIVNRAISEVGRKWEDVYNRLDGQGNIVMSNRLTKTIDQMTY